MLDVIAPVMIGAGAVALATIGAASLCAFLVVKLARGMAAAAARLVGAAIGVAAVQMAIGLF